MAEKTRKLLNPVKNLVATPFRLVSSVAHRGADLMHAVGDIIKDEFHIIKNTGNGIAQSFSSVRSKKGLFSKVGGVFNATVDSILGTLDGAGRLLIGPAESSFMHIGEQLEATRKDLAHILTKSLSIDDPNFKANRATRIKDIDRVASKSYFNNLGSSVVFEADKPSEKSTKKTSSSQTNEKTETKQNKKAEKSLEKQTKKNEKQATKQEQKNLKKQAKEDKKSAKQKAKQEQKEADKKAKQERKNIKKNGKAQRKEDRKTIKQREKLERKQKRKQNRIDRKADRKQRRLDRKNNRSTNDTPPETNDTPPIDTE